jgi:hypothetical protein
MDIHYHALPAQAAFLGSAAKFAGLFGGIGSGKSHVGCFWSLLKALRNPRCMGLIGANSYRQLKDATLRTFLGLLDEAGLDYTFRSTDMKVLLANGAVVLCRSMDQHDFLRGIELGWFYLDELRDTRFEAWQMIKGRLRASESDALEGRVTSSPNGFDWIHEEFVRKPADPATADDYAGHAAFFARTEENWHLPEGYVAALRHSYDPLLAAQELGGQFINIAQGRIYHAFDRAAHADESAEFVPGEPVCWSLDFNVHPMTAVIAQRERGGLRVTDELWLAHSNTAAMCRAFADWLDERGAASADDAPRLQIYGDATGTRRSTAGPSDYAIIREHFPNAEFCVPRANPPRRDRYNAVNAALRDAAGRARLRVHPRCRRLIEDLERHTYQVGTSEPDLTDPLRGHISDALGYLVARVLPAGRPTVRVGRW